MAVHVCLCAHWEVLGAINDDNDGNWDKREEKKKKSWMNEN